MRDDRHPAHRHDVVMGCVYFLAAILFGLFLYWLRCRHRSLYGVAEIVVPLLLLYIFFFPEGHGYTLTGNSVGPFGPEWGKLLSRGVTLVGGLCALVRGLDNLGALEKWNRMKQGVRQRFNFRRALGLKSEPGRRPTHMAVSLTSSGMTHSRARRNPRTKRHDSFRPKRTADGKDSHVLAQQPCSRGAWGSQERGYRLR